MSAIAETAELAVDHTARFDYIRVNSLGRQLMSPDEAVLATVAKSALMFTIDWKKDGVLDSSEGELLLLVTGLGFDEHDPRSSPPLI